jgi:hypothetical protein
MSHFNPTVSLEVQTKLKEFADMVSDNFISEFRECFGCMNISTIDGIESSGYIPLQKGGFNISEFYRNGIDPTFLFTKKQKAFNDKLYDDFITEYKRENSLDEIDYDDNEYQRCECDLFESSLLEFRIWIDNDDMVQIYISVNYKDAPYYRYEKAESMVVCSMTIDDLMKLDIEKYLIELETMVNDMKK